VKRTAPVLLALVGLALAPTAHAAEPLARVTLTSCTTGLEPAQRTVTYEGRMRRIAATRKMQMRFALQSRAPGAQRWAGVKGPGLGVWVTSKSGVVHYSFSKLIENLGAPASYRVIVRFRWLDASGHKIDDDQITSKVCQQPDLRPDLVAKRIDVERIGDPARRRYVVVVRNDGATAAGAFDVGLTLPTVALAPQHVVDLGPGASTLVSFEGPRCQAGDTLTAAVDTGGLVDEADEDDDTLAVACPQPGS
jgi:CARDB protein